jgi:hypothetical protein
MQLMAPGPSSEWPAAAPPRRARAACEARPRREATPPNPRGHRSVGQEEPSSLGAAPTRSRGIEPSHSASFGAKRARRTSIWPHRQAALWLRPHAREHGATHAMGCFRPVWAASAPFRLLPPLTQPVPWAASAPPQPALAPRSAGAPSPQRTSTSSSGRTRTTPARRTGFGGGASGSRRAGRAPGLSSGDRTPFAGLAPPLRSAGVRPRHPPDPARALRSSTSPARMTAFGAVHPAFFFGAIQCI